MEYLDHIKNILKETMRGGMNPGEGVDEYLNRQAARILSYVPEEKKQPIKDSMKIGNK